MRLHTIPPQLVPDVWDAAKPYLVSALDYHPFLDGAGLLKLLLSGHATLIIGIEDRLIGAGAMERVCYPSGQVVGNVIAMGGDPGYLAQYLDATFDHAEQWCRSQGCDTMGLYGRRGWTRLITRRGWTVQPGICAWKRLEERDHRFHPARNAIAPITVKVPP